MQSKKASVMDKYYRAYSEYLNSMKDVANFQTMKSALAHANNGEDTFSGSIAHRNIDMEWIEAIEAALPYIDKAIREQRRFISQTEEIVPIAKSKKVTTESVRHLAQHTNMIGKVEDNKVTPKSILNIQREESFAIYENRFLRALVNRAIEFVGRCYAKIKDTEESAVAGVNMERDTTVEMLNFRVALHCDLEYRESNRDVDINEDVSGLSGYERIIRLRKILSDFLAAPLIMSLAGAPDVRSPITRTNLLTKDQNFREALKLWEFFDNYDKPGFSLIIEENPAKMQSGLQNGIYDVMSLLQFVIRLNLSSDLRDMLQANYEAENQRRAKEAEEAELARQAEEAKRLASALAALSAEYEAKIAEREVQVEAEKAEINDRWQEKFDASVASYEKQLADAESAHAVAMEAQRTQMQDAYNDAVGRYEALIAEREERHTWELAQKADMYQNQISDLKEEHEQRIRVLCNDHEREIKEQAEIAEQREAESRVRMEEMQQRHDDEMTALRDNIKATVDAGVRKTQEDYKARIDAINKENVAKVDLLNKQHDDEINAVTKEKAKAQDEVLRLDKELRQAELLLAEAEQKKHVEIAEWKAKEEYSAQQARQSASKVQKLQRKIDRQSTDYSRSLAKVGQKKVSYYQSIADILMMKLSEEGLSPQSKRYINRALRENRYGIERLAEQLEKMNGSSSPKA